MKVELIYFKDTGKYYATGELEVPDDTDDLTLHRIIVSHMQNKCLPGLMEGSQFDTYYVGKQFEVPHIVRRPREPDVTTLKPDHINLLKISGDLTEDDVRQLADNLRKFPNLPHTVLLAANFEIEHEALEGYYFLGKMRVLDLEGGFTADPVLGEDVDGLYYGKPGEKVVELFHAPENREGYKLFDYSPAAEQLIIKLNERLKE